ncbi:MAG: hypothetical protein EPN21_16440 [Methylococcaceae bacterium]|nr:MAG: hypothetical protein EPN21_16440 [Methylococcaceae bacterium]
MQNAYESALRGVNKPRRAEEMLREALTAFATPLEVAEYCLAPVLERVGGAGKTAGWLCRKSA